jgi:hypothetical protein
MCLLFSVSIFIRIRLLSFYILFFAPAGIPSCRHFLARQFVMAMIITLHEAFPYGCLKSMLLSILSQPLHICRSHFEAFQQAAGDGSRSGIITHHQSLSPAALASFIRNRSSFSPICQKPCLSPFFRKRHAPPRQPCSFPAA